MAAFAAITGTVTVTLGGGEQTVAEFTVPVTTSLDDTTGTVTLDGAPAETIKAFMAIALQTAADELLDSLPTAIVETVAVCPTCSAELGVQDPSTTIEHGEDGAHVVKMRYTR